MLVAACAPIEERVDGAARQAAKGSVAETLATRFPEVTRQLISPATDCIVEFAMASEVRTFARSGVVGVDDETEAAARAVLARPKTQQCLSARGAALRPL